MRKLTTLMGVVALLVVALAGIAYAADLNLGKGKDIFQENNDPQCVNDSVTGGSGRDELYFNTSNETNCPNGDVDFGNGGRDADDLVNVADSDTLDTAKGGGGRGDRCIIGVDQNHTADTSDDTSDAVDGECERVTRVYYNQPQS